MGVVSLVFGIISLVLCWFPVLNWFALVLSVVGIVMGAVGMGKAKRAGESSGLATAGLVLCIVATVFGGILILACGAVAAASTVV